MTDVGFDAIKPQIDQFSFRKAGHVTLNLADGRTLNSFSGY